MDDTFIGQGPFWSQLIFPSPRGQLRKMPFPPPARVFLGFYSSASGSRYRVFPSYEYFANKKERGLKYIYIYK